MYPISDRAYLKICANIASTLSISLASAKKKVELEISKKGLKTIEDKRKIANEILLICQKENADGSRTAEIFDELMESLGDNDNFLVED
tara:strand:- start:1398 stop:1664 length:267 start_codon:yes stop_codon:yes gene_type:complete